MMKYLKLLKVYAKKICKNQSNKIIQKQYMQIFIQQLIQNIDGILINFQYVQRHGCGNAVKGQWSHNLTNKFIECLSDGTQNGKLITYDKYGKFRLDQVRVSRVFHYPGESCYDKYRSLLKKGRISNLIALYQKTKQEKQKIYLYNRCFIKAFTPKQDKYIKKNNQNKLIKETLLQYQMLRSQLIFFTIFRNNLLRKQLLIKE